MTDVDAWIEGAQRTQRSAVLHSRADLVAPIKLAHRGLSAAREADDLPKIAELEDELVALGKQFNDSEMIVTVRGHTLAESQAIISRAQTDSADDDETGLRLLSDAITDPPMTVAQLRALRAAVGEPQMTLIVLEYRKACSVAPEITGE